MDAQPEHKGNNNWRDGDKGAQSFKVLCPATSLIKRHEALILACPDKSRLC